jgi:hypothetical protein
MLDGYGEQIVSGIDSPVHMPSEFASAAIQSLDKSAGIKSPMKNLTDKLGYKHLQTN